MHLRVVSEELVTYKITRGLGRVSEGVCGGLGQGGGGLGGLGEVKRGLLDPYRALFSPLKVLYDTKFGPKHHMMVQMANVYKIDITDPFLDL